MPRRRNWPRYAENGSTTALAALGIAASAQQDQIIGYDTPVRYFFSPLCLSFQLDVVMRPSM